MNFETIFKVFAYSIIGSGFFTLVIVGGVWSWIVAVFVVAIIFAWSIEGKSWQISERLGLGLIFLFLPVFYFDWRWQLGIGISGERAGATTLAHLIIFLSLVKLFQKKGYRDWIFLYLISFFEVLLAAGLTISPLFFISLIIYLFFAVSGIAAFEMVKSQRQIVVENVFLDSYFNADKILPNRKLAYRLPLITGFLLILIVLVSIPTFFIMPRTNSASFVRSYGSLSGFVGFSDSVKLGEISKLQQNDEVVMRIKVEQREGGEMPLLRWRGVTLDSFDNQKWRKSTRESELVNANENGIFKFGTAKNIKDLTLQTIYLEPIETPTLFGASRILLVQSNFPFLQIDSESATISFPRNESGRLIYKVYSDTSLPDYALLRRDNTPYSPYFARYLQLPKTLDSRIGDLAVKITKDSNAKNRYETAVAMESYLKNNYGYTLDLKAGGDEPLADFLFNVREGHCEYFATAMAIMLRTEGIATRIVNGFQTGEYNETAGVYVVTQKEAHSWVEVYFPKEDTWVAFDPTPSVAPVANPNFSSSILKTINKYTEALQTFWIQYVVSFDNQGQRSLAKSLRSSFEKYQDDASNRYENWQKQINDWWKSLRGQKGTTEQLLMILKIVIGLILLGLTIVLTVVLIRYLRRLSIWKKFGFSRQKDKQIIVIEFYERMTKALAKRGQKREPSQTPLEFACALAIPEALQITEAYNKVRFGEKDLNKKESEQIDNWLKNLEKREPENN